MNDKEKRNKKIISEIKKGKGYSEIGKIFNLSRQRIYQIHASNKNCKLLRSLELEIRNCQKCGKRKGFYQLGIHHIDGNPNNNNRNNLIVLCQSCHAKEHNNKFKKNIDNMGRPKKYNKAIIVKFRIEEEDKKKYKQICQLRGTTMQGDFNKYIKSQIEGDNK